MKSALPALSAQTYTVREYIQTDADFATSLAKIRAIGYQAVEISYPDIFTSADVRTILNDTGLVASGIHYDFAFLQNRLDDALECNHALDSQHLLLTMMPEAYAEQGVAGFQRFIDEIIPLAERVHAANFTLSYHNHNYEFTRLAAQTGLAWILDATAPHHLAAQLDTYWIQMGGGDPVKWIQRLAGRLPTIHLKDFAVEMWTPIFAEVGRGNLDWAAIIPACRAAGVEWFVVEQDECRRDPFESLRLSHEFLINLGLE